MTGSIQPIAFHLGPWPVYWYGLIIGVGMFSAYRLMLHLAKKRGLLEETLLDFMFWSILIGFIGARIYYVIFQWDYYRQHLDQIIQIWNGGLAIYGGVLAGAGTILYLARKKELNPWVIFDVAAPGLLLAQAIGRWGNFMNQEAYGGVVSLEFLQSLHLPSWLIEHMYIEGAYHHPTFLYESVWNIIGVFILLFISKRRQGSTGEVACGYLIWYGLGRMVIEGMRTDSLYLGPLRVSQWLSGILVLIGIALLLKRDRRNYLVKRGR